MPLTRRELIRTGAAGAVVLALAGCARSSAPARPPFDDPGYAYAVLSGSDRTMLAAFAAVMLAGALSSGPESAAALVQVVRGVDVALSGLPPGPVGEIRQLFGLLEFAPTRALAGGVWSAWQDASFVEIANFFARWRYSRVTLFRSGYQALHTLLMSAWYGNAASWPRIGYPGPPVVNG